MIDSAIEKSVACLVLLDQLLLLQFMVSERLSVLFEFPSERVFTAIRVVLSASRGNGCVLGSHEGSVRGRGPSACAMGSLHSSVSHCRLLGGCGHYRFLILILLAGLVEFGEKLLHCCCLLLGLLCGIVAVSVILRGRVDSHRVVALIVLVETRRKKVLLSRRGCVHAKAIESIAVVKNVSSGALGSCLLVKIGVYCVLSRIPVPDQRLDMVDDLLGAHHEVLRVIRH